MRFGRLVAYAALGWAVFWLLVAALEEVVLWAVYELSPEWLYRWYERHERN